MTESTLTPFWQTRIPLHLKTVSKFIVMGRGIARSSNQAPNNATQTKQKAHKQE